jgi:hypothetical protein
MKDKIKKYIKEGIFFIIILIIMANGISYYKSLDLNKNKLDIQKINLY